MTISDLPGIDKEIAQLLKNNGIDSIEDFVEAYDNGSIEIEGVSKEALDKVNDLVNENVEIVEEDSAEETESSENAAEKEGQEEKSEDGDEDEYFCPECGHKITLDMTHCPNCGVEFEFTEDEE